MTLELLLVVALAQEASPEREKPRVRSQVNFRLHEWFDETRADGVTDAGHPATLDLPFPNGGMTFHEFWRLMGAVDGGTGLAGLEVSIGF